MRNFLTRRGGAKPIVAVNATTRDATISTSTLLPLQKLSLGLLAFLLIVPIDMLGNAYEGINMDLHAHHSPGNSELLEIEKLGISAIAYLLLSRNQS